MRIRDCVNSPLKKFALGWDIGYNYVLHLLLSKLAHRAQGAACAVGPARGADGAAVQHDAVAEVGAFLRRQAPAQLGLDLHGVLEVIDQTQVVDGVLQRSNIMRSSNAVVKQATSFMGEPIMSLNLLMRAYDQVRYEQNSQKRGKAIKTIHFVGDKLWKTGE